MPHKDCCVARVGLGCVPKYKDMEQLTEKEKNKQRRIYKWCMAAFALEGIFIVALALVGTIAPKSQAILKIAVFALVGSFVPVMIAAYILPRLKIRQHVDAEIYSLPYKLRREKTIFFIIGGVVLLVTIMMTPQVLSGKPFALTKNINLPGWTALPIVVWVPVGLFSTLLIVGWGVILSNDHLCQYWWWKKCNVFYRDINRIEIVRRATGQGSGYHAIVIHHIGASKSPLEFSLASVPATDCAIMIDVIQKNSPGVVLNGTAQQWSQGEFPLG
jgi:amino acid transporter